MAKNLKTKLSELFDAQIDTLIVRRYYYKSFIERVVSRKSEVIVKAMEAETPNGHIPFIVVIPLLYDLDRLMHMVENGARYGYCRGFHPSDLINVTDSDDFIFDVKYGNDISCKSLKEAEALIKKQKRSCLTVNEGVSLCIHTNVLLKEHCACFYGSRCCSFDDAVPSIYLDDGTPRLGCHDVNSFHFGCCPSCRNRT